MLILTRKSGEIIRIGDEISVSVIEIRGQSGAAWYNRSTRRGGASPGGLRVDSRAESAGGPGESG